MAAEKSFADWIRSPQVIVALSALLLSLCGLFVAVYEASLMRQSERASVWPYVQVSPSRSPERIAIWAQNTGVGPARIQKAALLHQDEILRSWSALVGELAPGDPIDSYRSMLSGRVLPAESERETIFMLQRSDDVNREQLVDDIWTAIVEGQLDVSVCYCSVYDECWVTSLQEGIRPEEDPDLQVVDNEVDDCDSAPKSAI